MTTGGKFLDAIEKFHSIMLSITLLAVDSKQEITEVSYIPKEIHYFLC